MLPLEVAKSISRISLAGVSFPAFLCSKMGGRATACPNRVPRGRCGGWVYDGPSIPHIPESFKSSIVDAF